MNDDDRVHWLSRAKRTPLPWAPGWVRFMDRVDAWADRRWAGRDRFPLIGMLLVSWLSDVHPADHAARSAGAAGLLGLLVGVAFQTCYPRDLRKRFALLSLALVAVCATLLLPHVEYDSNGGFPLMTIGILIGLVEGTRLRHNRDVRRDEAVRAARRAESEALPTV